MEMVYIRAEICGELPSGQKRVKILANNADGISFYTDEKCIIRPEDIGIKCNPWIPVTERLPDLIPCGAGSSYSEAVNVLTSGRKVLTAIWDGTEFIADADFWDAEGEDITHWTPVLLPLPDPQKEARI